MPAVPSYGLKGQCFGEEDGLCIQDCGQQDIPMLVSTTVEEAVGY